MNWTRKAPTVAGWYWWRNLLTDNAPEVWAIVDHGDGLEVVGPFDETALDEWVSDMGGEWLGPLSPDSYQQGRVAGLREACIAVSQFSSDGVPINADELRIALVQLLGSLAQQAQEGEWVGDGN